MLMPTCRSRRACSAAAMAVAALVGGCASGDVELNGAIFDYMGVSTKAQSRPREPQVAARPGLVLPPQPDRLPEPGTGAVADAPAAAWPDDPDQRRLASASDLERRQKEFCSEALWKAKARGDTSPIRGPNGVCSPSILQALTGENKLENLPAPSAPKQ